MPQNTPDPTLRQAKREAILILSIWLLALCYTVGVCWWMGYRRDPADLKLIFGMPDWVLIGILVPWLLMLPISAWIAFGFMPDEPANVDPSASTAGEKDHPND
jgi:hypothetical protein